MWLPRPSRPGRDISTSRRADPDLNTHGVPPVPGDVAICRVVDTVLDHCDEDHVNEEDDGGEKGGEEACAEGEEGRAAGKAAAARAGDE